MTERVDAADCAKLVRKALKARWPGHRFSVRTSRYSMGSSISVRYEDGPPVADVNRIVSAFQGASFDGTQDLKTYHTSTLEGRQVSFGADFVSASRDQSAKTREAIKAIFEAELGLSADGDARIAFDFRDGVFVAGASEYTSSVLRQMFHQTDLYMADARHRYGKERGPCRVVADPETGSSVFIRARLCECGKPVRECMAFRIANHKRPRSARRNRRIGVEDDR
jgi:hypothetical protein